MLWFARHATNSLRAARACRYFALGEGALDLLADAHSRLQRHEAGLPGNDRRASAADAIEKGIDLGLKSVARLETLLLDGHRERARPIGGRALADHGQDFLLQVERQISIVFEDPQLALRLDAHTRGGGVGDAAVRETDARVGDVDALGEPRRTNGIDRLDRGAYDGLHDVDVVNHQIEDHIHVGAALAIRGEAMTLDEARRAQVGFGGEDCGVEALEMTYLQD